MSTNKMEEGPPPSNHTLKPHHLQILRIFQVLFIIHGEKKFSSQFMLQIYRILMIEIGEVRQPPTYDELIDEIKKAAKPTSDIERRALQQIDEWGLYLLQPEQLVEFFKQIKTLVPATGDDDDETSKFARRSLFGYFVRRCHLSFSKLSFEGVEGLWLDWFKWALGELDESKVTIKKDIISNEYNIFKTQSDKKEYAQPEAFGLWEHGLAVGDEVLATENLRRFFEQHFHDLNDSGLRQHALLNLARMHYLRHQYVACRKLLQEAIAAARTSNDKYTLQHCIGLQNRLPPLEKGQKPIINELQAQVHPVEVLYDAKKLLTVTYQQPISTVFEKITQGAILYDVWSDSQPDLVTEAEQWGSHCVQAVAWGMLGNPQLASIEDNVVFAFTEAGGPDNTRLTSHLNRAYQIARQGGYKDAISILLNPSVWSGLMMADYQLWANEIWHILVLRTSRRGQDGMYQQYLRLKRPDGLYAPRAYWFNSPVATRSLIRDPLYDAISARERKQGHSAIEPLLTAIWHAEFMQRFNLYRAALVLLADVGLEFGLTKWCRRIIEEIMPQLINGDEREQRALACFTLARCIIAAGDATPGALKESLHYLRIAEDDYVKMEMYSRLEDVQFFTSVVHHNLGQTAESEEAALRHQATSAQRAEAAAAVLEDWVTEVWDLVAEVGAGLAAR